MADATSVELLYSGTDVDDGTVPVEDMVDALVGFSGAYSKLARDRESPDEGHRIRVVGLQKGSARIFVDVIEWVTKNPAAAGVLVTGGSLAATGAYRIVKDIAAVIKGKKALEGQPITNNSYTFNDNRVILQGVELTPEQFGYLQSGELDTDLDRITRPLDKGRGADEFKLKAGDEELVTVDSKDRPYFSNTETNVTTTRDDVWLEGTLNSHSKRNNKGMFHTRDGRHIPYRYVADELQPLLRGYAYNGVVKVLGKVKFDANNEPISIEIREIQLTQQPLF
jgi:hypothetical protein